MGVATIGAGAEGAFISGVGAAAFLTAVFLAVFVAAFLATLVTAVFTVFVATFLVGVFLTAAFLAAFAGLAPLLLAGSLRESSVLFWLIRSMFWKRGVVEFFYPREKGEDGEGKPMI